MSTPPAEELAELHEQLRQVARELLAGKAGEGEQQAEVSWPRLAAAGWLELEVTGDLGGADATFAEVAVVLVALGRAASRSGYVGSAVLGTGALNLVDGAAAGSLLQGAAMGSRRLALVLPTGDDLRASFRLSAVGGALALEGETAFVPDVKSADTIVVSSLGADEIPVLVVLQPGQAGVQVAEQPVLDLTRSLGSVTARAAPVDPSNVWRYAGDPERSLRRLIDRGALAVACDSLGLAEAMLEATVDYAGVRHQFGRAIGSFQAVKHACADMLVEVTVGRELLIAAIEAVCIAAPTPQQDAAASVAVSMAKSYLGQAAVDVAGKAMQLHGGYGYTWESGVHVYLKRAVLNRSLFGSPAAHRRRLAERYLKSG